MMESMLMMVPSFSTCFTAVADNDDDGGVDNDSEADDDIDDD